MKKIMFAALCAALMVSCDTKKESGQNESLKKENEALKQENSQKDDEYNELLSLISQVQEGFKQINEAEGRVIIANGNLEQPNAQEQIAENMRFIQSSMEQYRNMISQLEKRISTSTANANSLKSFVANLKTQMEEKTAQIAELQQQLEEKDIMIAAQGDQIDALTESVNQLNEQNEQNAQVMEVQETELSTAWYALGTRADLKEEKILVKGEVLKDKQFNKNYFTKIDIRSTKEIALNSGKAKLLTAHPEGSYSMAKGSDGMLTLKITDATAFWNMSKYLVVQVEAAD